MTTHSLKQLFELVNQGHQIPVVSDTETGDYRKHHAFLIALLQLKQRMQLNGAGSRLVERLRVEMITRKKPVRDINANSLTAYPKRIAALAPTRPVFSHFQVSGWEVIRDTIEKRKTAVVLAPTGSGKTEVFVLPVVDAIAQSLPKGQSQERFLMIYPRVELLKDQLARIMLAVHYAEKTLTGQRIIIGFQFGGITASLEKTLKSKEIFEHGKFLTIKQCPVCQSGSLEHTYITPKNATTSRYTQTKDYGEATESSLTCQNPACGATWRVSLSKEQHRYQKPSIMVTTAESLDRFYLDPRFEEYLRLLTGITLDEAHLYHGIYGTHIQQVFERVDKMRGEKPFTRIASSATITDPQSFIAKLMHGNENAHVYEHNATTMPLQDSGTEYAYFIQATTSDDGFGRHNPAFIQTVMLLGHGVLNTDERILAFVDSVDLTQYFERDIRDAEVNLGLWKFRTDINLPLSYNGHTCPQSSPERCIDIFHVGECWRGIHSVNCHLPISGMREKHMDVFGLSGSHKHDFMIGDALITTPVLEVGVDDDRIIATVHYQAPKTGVHGFIQRRGRAGRGQVADAFTVMVLGQSPTEQYYFYRRHRLLQGKYELPLNTNNEIIKQIHNELQKARDEVALRYKQSGSKYLPSLHGWFIDQICNCKLLNELYPNYLQTLKPGDGLKGALHNWIEAERQIVRNRLELSSLLRNLKDDAPSKPDIQQAVKDALQMVQSYGKKIVQLEEVKNAFIELNRVLSEHEFSDSTDEQWDFPKYQQKIRDVWRAVNTVSDRRLRFAEQLYDFFETLDEFRENGWWKLTDATETIKITLRALFFLHMGEEVSQHEGSCSAKQNLLIPNVYFGESRVIVVEATVKSQTQYKPERHTVSSSFLASLLIPYAITTRYYSKSMDATIDLNYDERESYTEDGAERIIWVEPEGIQGIDRGDVFEPQKVQVRALPTNAIGSRLVQICPVCFRLHSITKSKCHEAERLRTVRIFPTVVREDNYSIQTKPIHFSKYFSLATKMQSQVIVKGSYVQVTPTFFNREKQRHEVNSAAPKQKFYALYKKPLGYTMPTDGIVWQLSDLVADLLKDVTLKKNVESIVFGEERQELTPALILETAGAMLQKAIGSVAGANMSNLAKKSNLDTLEVCVWEDIEGGAGFSQVFVNALRASPFTVFSEFLNCFLCPVYLGETEIHTPLQDISKTLREEWHIPDSDEQLNELLSDIHSERERVSQSDAQLTCSANDGCPACIGATENRLNRDKILSRFVAEAITKRFIKRINRSDLADLMVQHTKQNFVSPMAISEVDENGNVYVIVL